MEGRGLDLGAVPNLLIQTVGEIILEIIRAGDDVFTAAQQPGLGQGGGWHRSTFLILSRATIQRQIGRILRLLLCQLRHHGGELEAGLQVGFLDGQVDILVGRHCGHVRLLA